MDAHGQADDVNWEVRPRGGWEEFRARRDRFLLARAVDSALDGVPSPAPTGESPAPREGDVPRD